MANEHFLFFQKDIIALEKAIASLKDDLKTIGKEVGDLAHQSSETWHDNYGFEEADRERKRLIGRLEELQIIWNKAKVVEGQLMSSTVSLGSTVTIQYIEINIKQIIIVGSYMVLDKTNPNEFSYAAPLITSLLGATVGEMRTIEIHGTISHVQVVGIE
jgi:transcription elongation GreA/GreB family factor